MSKRPPDTVNRMSVHRSVGELLQKTFCEKNVWNIKDDISGSTVLIFYMCIATEHT